MTRPEVALAVGRRPTSNGCLAAYSAEADHRSGMMPNRAAAPRDHRADVHCRRGNGPGDAAQAVWVPMAATWVTRVADKDDYLELCRAIREILLPPWSEPAPDGLSKGCLEPTGLNGDSSPVVGCPATMHLRDPFRSQGR